METAAAGAWTSSLRSWPMLSTLLPGIRELRAPLAAGYIWLLAGWIALEPHIPEAGSSTGLIASIYRLNDALSGFGLAVAASFAAYLIGSLSITLFSPAIRQWFIGVPLSAPSLGPLAPLSEQGTSALSTLVRRTSDQMAVSLALTELTPDEVLQLEGISSDDRQSAPLGTAIRRPPSSRARRLVAPIIDRVYKRRRRRFTRIEIGSTVISFDPTSDLDQRQLQLVRRVVSEFDQIISTRLLGRDPDLFSAIDRHRAEVEFRLAVIPPLIVLSLAVATRVDLWAAPFVVVAGALAAFGLFVDAGERERKANDTLANDEPKRCRRPPSTLSGRLANSSTYWTRSIQARPARRCSKRNWQMSQSEPRPLNGTSETTSWQHATA
jgi:hypothetical protein